MTQYHHRAAKEVAKSLLNNWRSGHWANEFVSNDIFLTGSTSIHPSPDADFQDENKKTKISLEFKPHYENKRGMMTGLGQSIAYLNKSDASYLVSPSKLSDSGFDMEGHLNEIFNKFIKGKLPVGLVIYDGEELDNIRISVDIDNSLYAHADLKILNGIKGSEQPYWAFWRDYSVEAFYKLSLSALRVSSNMDRSEKVYDDFYFNFFTNPKIRESLNLINNDIFKPDMKSKMIPFETTKKKYKKEVSENVISHELAMKKFYDKCLSKKETDNLYRDYKKNLFSTMDHLNLWDENKYLTNLGLRFVERYEMKKDNLNELQSEFAQIILVEGKHDNLIGDIISFSENTELNGLTDTQFRGKLSEFFENSGFIKKNPNRVSSGIRKPLSALLQLWTHLGLKYKYDVNGNINSNGKHFVKDKGYIFNVDIIETLVQKFYENYGDVSEMISSEKQISAIN